MAGQTGAFGPSESLPGAGGLYPSISGSDLERLLALAHHDPHSQLGAHPVSCGVMTRAFKPEAEKVELLIGDDAPLEMVKVHSDGFFELLIEDRSDTFPYRQYHHGNLTFDFLYAWSENYLLPFSHDEVVHGKGSLLDKMQGDRWQKFANLRTLYGYMWAQPRKEAALYGLRDRTVTRVELRAKPGLTSARRGRS